MKISLLIAICLILVGVFNYDKISYKAMYLRNKKNNTGWYWGGIPRNEKTIQEWGNKKNI